MASSSRQPAVLHVDLDGARTIYRHHGWEYPWTDDPLFESGMENLLRFLERNGSKATLFTIAEDLDDPRKRAWIDKAVAAGHEIASHSVSHPEFDELTPSQKSHEIAESKRKLEAELGVTVRGFRAPSYQIDRGMIDTLVAEGFAYDSSCRPDRDFAERLDVPVVQPFPYRPFLDESFVELPLPGGKPFHPSYALVYGNGYFDRKLAKFARQNVPLVLLFHLTDFADPLPKDRLRGLKSKMYTLSQRDAKSKDARCQKMIESVKRRFELTTTDAILESEPARRAPKLVLGLSTTHETGAALFRGHECLAAISEERLDRVKFSTKFPPKLAIAEVIRIAGIDPKEITDVVVAGLPAGRLARVMLRGQWRDTTEFHGFNDYFPHFNKALYRAFAWTRSLGYGRVLGFLREKYGIAPRLHFVEHHRCHAASVYRTAPYDDAMIFTADGVGDDLSITISTGRRGRIETHLEIPYPHSFGQFYTACTQILGFRANRHEGKITGLSGFGTCDRELYRKVKSTIRESGPGFRLDKRYYSEGIIRGFSLKMFRKGEDLFETLQYRNYKAPLARLLQGYPREEVASVFQTLLEEELVEIMRPYAERFGLKNLCLAGGIFANVKANASVFRELNFDQVYIYPNMGDGGLCAGAALELTQARPEPFDKVYWGPEYSDEEIERALRAAAGAGLQYRREANIEKVIAERLAEHKVIARFNGRMEFGPRALCNRTILYGADEPEANNWLNKRLGRTEFMPFAPVALEEDADRFFVDREG
ncbi:MAG: polysaccharide deacetylase family protein, partial [Planctomycetes bacterium]|nr:polysaccharide deacetylase family protein [Planctomycetota bacterium]